MAMSVDGWWVSGVRVVVSDRGPIGLDVGPPQPAIDRVGEPLECRGLGRRQRFDFEPRQLVTIRPQPHQQSVGIRGEAAAQAGIGGQATEQHFDGAVRHAACDCERHALPRRAAAAVGRGGQVTLYESLTGMRETRGRLWERAPIRTGAPDRTPVLRRAKWT